MPHRGSIQTTKEKISELAAKKLFSQGISPAGTIVMSFKLTIGKISILGRDAFHNEAIISIFPYKSEMKDFLFVFLPDIASWSETNAAIKGSTLNKSSLQLLKFPLPPLDEQQRIVERVNELMALCDNLEAQLADSERLGQHLLASLVHHIANPASPVLPDKELTLC
jgi:type I restriction enzyme, S subunit